MPNLIKGMWENVKGQKEHEECGGLTTVRFVSKVRGGSGNKFCTLICNCNYCMCMGNTNEGVNFVYGPNHIISGFLSGKLQFRCWKINYISGRRINPILRHSKMSKERLIMYPYVCCIQGGQNVIMGGLR